MIRVTDPAKALALSQTHKQAGVVGLPLMHLASLNPHQGPLKTSLIATIATDVVSALREKGMVVSVSVFSSRSLGAGPRKPKRFVSFSGLVY